MRARDVGPTVRVLENGNGSVRIMDAHRSECAFCTWTSTLMASHLFASDALSRHVADEHRDECNNWLAESGVGA